MPEGVEGRTHQQVRSSIPIQPGPWQSEARRVLVGELTPREFTFRIHHRHGHELAATEPLADLDDEYDTLEYGDQGLSVNSVVWSAVYPVRRPHVVRDSGACGAQMVA
ncbi:hypothetical protein [Streptomyces sp. NPDC093589]|uniref:hypothetical protein n=1 Tax=Streptomyces sp. NPDC093589 TaxID=3366043 RepID=UPI0038093B6C